MPKVPYHYEVNGNLVTGNGSLIPICSLSNRSLSPSLTVWFSIWVGIWICAAQNLGSSHHASVVRVLDQTISSLARSYITNLEGLLFRTTSILTLKLWPSLQRFKLKRNVKKEKFKISDENSITYQQNGLIL